MFGLHVNDILRLIFEKDLISKHFGTAYVLIFYQSTSIVVNIQTTVGAQ